MENVPEIYKIRSYVNGKLSSIAYALDTETLHPYRVRRTLEELANVIVEHIFLNKLPLYKNRQGQTAHNLAVGRAFHVETKEGLDAKEWDELVKLTSSKNADELDQKIKEITLAEVKKSIMPKVPLPYDTDL